MLVQVRGAGDIATGVALRLWRAGMNIIMVDLPVPTSIRRTACFSEAIRLGSYTVEGVEGVFAEDEASALEIARSRKIAVMADPTCQSVWRTKPAVLVDCVLAKKNLGTTRDMAPLVIGVGPGFCAGEDVDLCVETKRGHYMGRVIYEGSPIANTGIPGIVGGYSAERVLRAPKDGIFKPVKEIGDIVVAGEVAAYVDGEPMLCTIDGVLRGLLQEGVEVFAGMKSGDIDPRCEVAHCYCSSDKAIAVGGGVLEAILNTTGVLAG